MRASYNYVVTSSTTKNLNEINKGTRFFRLSCIYVIALIWSFAVVVRLFMLQLGDTDFWRNWGKKQHYSKIELAPERAPMYDRNGKLVAVSVPNGSVYIRPKQVKKKDREKIVLALTETLDVDPDFLRKLLDSKQPFVWVKRQIPKEIAERIKEFSFRGVGYEIEPKRYYPYNEAGGALIGRVNIDGKGLSGLEALYDKFLSGNAMKAIVTRDALGHKIIEKGKLNNFEPPKGNDLHLTIDIEMQQILDQELMKGREEFAAKAALGALVNAMTGDIWALGQAPSYNFNKSKIEAKDALMNRTIEMVFEPGSIMKPIVTAAALDFGVVRPTDIIDCEAGRYRFGGHTIKDTHHVGAVTVSDVVVHSSNIGMTKIGEKLGRDNLYEALVNFGFGQAIGLGLSGETSGILRKKERWSTVDIATHSFGQGVAVTPLQMIRALSSVVNGGILPKLRVIDNGEGLTGNRIITAKTAAEMRDIMFQVVESDHGTGKKAAIKGIRIGGKTGTAQKARKDGRGYAAGKYVASFMGFADASSIGVNDRLALIIMVDEPSKGSIYGGTVSAPIFRNTMIRVVHELARRQHLN